MAKITVALNSLDTYELCPCTFDTDGKSVLTCFGGKHFVASLGSITHS